MANTSFSDYLELKITNHIFRTATWAKVTNLYFALLTAAPSDSGAGTEVTGGNYARVQVTPSDSNFTVSGGVATNATAITFTAPSASWGTVTHIAIYDALTAGNLLLWAELVSPKTVGATDPAPYYAPEAFTCTYASTSTELATQVLSFLFKTLATWTKPSGLYFDFYTVAPTPAGGGTKATGGSYAAATVTPLDANFSLTVNGSNGTTAITNAAGISFPAPTAAWGAVRAVGVSTSANMFICFAAFNERTINAGDAAPVLSAGTFAWAIN